MITVTLYSRQDCPLCDQAIADLETLQGSIPHKLVVLDVDSNPELKKTFGFEVPVVVIDPYRLKAPFSLQDLQMTLSAAQDRERHIEMVEQSPKLAEVRARAKWTNADSISYWLAKHYMACLNLVFLFYLGMSFMAR